MFSHASVILFTEGGGLFPGGLCPGGSVRGSLSVWISVQGVSIQEGGSLSRRGVSV